MGKYDKYQLFSQNAMANHYATHLYIIYLQPKDLNCEPVWNLYATDVFINIPYICQRNPTKIDCEKVPPRYSIQFPQLYFVKGIFTANLTILCNLGIFSFTFQYNSIGQLCHIVSLIFQYKANNNSLFHELVPGNLPST